jgi:hypothetical protein
MYIRVIKSDYNFEGNPMSEPESIGNVLKRIGINVASVVSDKIEDAQGWREWAIKVINRIDMQDASNEQLRAAIESKLA